MSNRPIKTNPKFQCTPASEPQARKRGLLLRFIIFIAWVVVIGLFISLVACQQSEPVIFVIRIGSL